VCGVPLYQLPRKSTYSRHSSGRMSALAQRTLPFTAPRSRGRVARTIQASATAGSML